MLTPTKTYKMSKQTKRFMCTIINPIERGEYKRAMIQAELASQVVVKSKRDKR